MWSISVGDFSSCVCDVCDCLHKTSAQRYSECVLVLHEIMFHYDIEQIIWRTSKWKRTMHIRMVNKRTAHDIKDMDISAYGVVLQGHYKA